MDKGTTGVTALTTDDGTKAAAVEQEIESIRGNLDRLMAELDHRRHQLNPIRLLRRHPLWFVAIGAVLLGGATGATVLAYRAHSRKQHSWLERARRLQSTARRVMSGKPIEQPPNVLLKALIAATSGAAAIAGRHLASRLFARKPR